MAMISGGIIRPHDPGEYERAETAHHHDAPHGKDAAGHDADDGECQRHGQRADTAEQQ